MNNNAYVHPEANNNRDLDIIQNAASLEPNLAVEVASSNVEEPENPTENQVVLDDSAHSFKKFVNSSKIFGGRLIDNLKVAEKSNDQKTNDGAAKDDNETKDQKNSNDEQNEYQDSERRLRLLKKFGKKKSNPDVNDGSPGKTSKLKDYISNLKSREQGSNKRNDAGASSEAVNNDTGLEVSTPVNPNSNNMLDNGGDNNRVNELDAKATSRRNARFPNINVLLQKYAYKRNTCSVSNLNESNMRELQTEKRVPEDGDVKKNRNGLVWKLRNGRNGLKEVPVEKDNNTDGTLVKKSSLPSKQQEYVDTETMCGVFGMYPVFLQRFATPRQFLLVFCLQNVLQGAAGSLFIAISTSLEKHFHFSSSNIGAILMFSEIGPILSSMILSHLGGRGNRPRWMAVGQLLSTLGMLLAFSNYLFYPPPEVDGWAAPSSTSRQLCRYRDLFTQLIVPLQDSARSSAALSTDFENENCFPHNESAFCSWLLVHILIGVGNSLVYAIGAPYLDDSIEKKDSPIYFAISISVRILGPLLGFTFTAGLLKIYVHPFTDPGIQPSDPRWVGAWWIGCLIIGTLFGVVAIITVFFPRKMKKDADVGRVRGDSERGAVTGDKQPLEIEDASSSSRVNGVVTFVNPPHNTSDSVNVVSEPTIITTSNDTHLENEAINGDINEVAAVKEAKEGSRGEGKELTQTEGADGTPDTFKMKMKEFWLALKRLLRNPVLVYGYCSDFFGFSGTLAVFMWLPKYLEHQFRVDKSTSALFTGIAGLSSVVLGVLGGGIFIKTCQPSARTLTLLIATCKFVYILSLFGMMKIHCDFNEDLPGVLSMDGTSLDLYRGCSGGCLCSTAEFVPVCVRDGTLQVSFFSPCHAGCYTPGTHHRPDGLVALDPNGEELPPPLVDEGTKYYSNCSCGSARAEVRSGYCRETCGGFTLFNLVHAAVNSFVSIGTIGGVLIALRCVAEGDKAIALGLKSSIISLAMLLNPVIMGSLTDSSCLVWEEVCQQIGACWVYNARDLGYNIFITAMICNFVSFIFELFVYRNVACVKLFDEDLTRRASSTRTLSSTLSSVLGTRFMNRFSTSKTSATSKQSNDDLAEKPTALVNTFRRLSRSSVLVEKVFRPRKTKSKDKIEKVKSNGADENLKESDITSESNAEGDLQDVTLESNDGKFNLAYDNKAVELDTELRIEGTDVQTAQINRTKLNSTLRVDDNSLNSVDSLEQY